jgi:hypothetical protein
MEIVKRELVRHTIILSEVMEILYSNPKHIKGIAAYKEKKRLLYLKERVQKKQQLLRRRDLQFLQGLINKYSR